jgi:hypothetical protein
VHVLHGPNFERAKFEVDGKYLSLLPIADTKDFVYNMIVVDEAHHAYRDLAEDFAERYTTRSADEGGINTVLLLLSDISQATSSGIKYPPWDPHRQKMKEVRLNEVVRCSMRIIEAVRAFQMDAEEEEEAECHHNSSGPALIPLLFDPTSQDTAGSKVLQALQVVMDTFPGLNLHDRVAIIAPDEDFIQAFKKSVCDSSSDGEQESVYVHVGDQRFRLVSAEEANRTLWSSRAANHRDQCLVLDTVDNFNGLERLIVIAVELDAPIDKEGARTRSRFYRALTRAQILAMAVNETIRGGGGGGVGCVFSAAQVRRGERFRKREGAGTKCKRAGAQYY